MQSEVSQEQRHGNCRVDGSCSRCHHRSRHSHQPSARPSRRKPSRVRSRLAATATASILPLSLSLSLSLFVHQAIITCIHTYTHVCACMLVYKHAPVLAEPQGPAQPVGTDETSWSIFDISGKTQEGGVLLDGLAIFRARACFLPCVCVCGLGARGASRVAAAHFSFLRHSHQLTLLLITKQFEKAIFGYEHSMDWYGTTHQPVGKVEEGLGSSSCGQCLLHHTLGHAQTGLFLFLFYLVIGLIVSNDWHYFDAVVVVVVDDDDANSAAAPLLDRMPNSSNMLTCRGVNRPVSPRNCRLYRRVCVIHQRCNDGSCRRVVEDPTRVPSED